MSNVADLLQPVIDKAVAQHRAEPEDYIDDEGFLVCGRCNTRRETIIQFPGTDVTKKVPSMCDCRKAARDAEEEKRKLDELVARLRDVSLMDSRLRKATFDNFIIKERNAKCHRLLKSYADRFDQMAEKSQGLLLYGSVGTGKTYGAACIANQLLDQGISVVMTSFVKIIDEMRGFDDEAERMIARLNRAKLLIIDDLGAELDTDFALEKVYSVIDARYRSKLPLILTTNLNMADMLAEEDIRYSRIYDRIFEMCFPIPFDGVSWRKAAAAERHDKMRAFMEEGK